MSLVFVVQEKNIKSVAELYKKVIKEIKAIRPRTEAITKNFLDFKI